MVDCISADPLLTNQRHFVALLKVSCPDFININATCNQVAIQVPAIPLHLVETGSLLFFHQNSNLESIRDLFPQERK